MVYRVITLVTPRLREILLRARARLAPMFEVEAITRRCKLGDWFLIYQLGKNMDPLIFKEFIHDLYKKFDQEDNARGIIS